MAAAAAAGALIWTSTGVSVDDELRAACGQVFRDGVEQLIRDQITLLTAQGVQGIEMKDFAKMSETELITELSSLIAACDQVISMLDSQKAEVKPKRRSSRQTVKTSKSPKTTMETRSASTPSTTATKKKKKQKLHLPRLLPKQEPKDKPSQHVIDKDPLGLELKVESERPKTPSEQMDYSTPSTANLGLLDSDQRMYSPQANLYDAPNFVTISRQQSYALPSKAGAPLQLQPQQGQQQQLGPSAALAPPRSEHQQHQQLRRQGEHLDHQHRRPQPYVAQPQAQPTLYHTQPLYPQQQNLSQPPYPYSGPAGPSQQMPFQLSSFMRAPPPIYNPGLVQQQQAQVQAQAHAQAQAQANAQAHAHANAQAQARAYAHVPRRQTIDPVWYSRPAGPNHGIPDVELCSELSHKNAKMTVAVRIWGDSFLAAKMFEGRGDLMLTVVCRKFNNEGCTPRGQKLVSLHGGSQAAHVHWCLDCFSLQGAKRYHPRHHRECPLLPIYNSQLRVNYTLPSELFLSPMPVPMADVPDGEM